jgi:phosphatidylglycerophosphatase A
MSENKEVKTQPSLAIFLATAGGLGYLPKAPGTFGSLPGLALGAGLHLSISFLYPVIGESGSQYLPFNGILIGVTFIFFASFFAWWTIKETEEAWQSHDDKRIVSDEVIGQAIASFVFVPNLLNLVLAFCLFRLFDIWKPSIIGWADRLPSSFGTLLDDILAGLFALVILSALLLIALPQW